MYKVFYSRNGTRYLYDSVSNHFFEVDDESYRLLHDDEGNTEQLRCFGTEFWNFIYGENPFPVLKEIEIETSPAEEPEILVLELTQQCNFRCEYCIYSGHYKYERKHKSINMSQEMVDSIIDQYFTPNSHPDYVSLYGGEPLLQFPLIKYIVEKIEADHFYPEYAMTTNASLILNEEIAKFLVEKKFRLTVSFDGINHDLYRKTMHQNKTSEVVLKALKILKNIDEEYFKEYVSLSITLAPPYKLLENADFFNSHELLSQVKLLINTINDKDSDFFDNIDYEEERKKLSDDYRQLANEFIDITSMEKPFHHALFASAMLRIENRVMELQSDAFPPGPCIPGKNRLFITATGEKYMCERVGTYGNLGNIYEQEKQIEKYHAVLNDFRNRITKYCKDCLYVRVCDACFSVFREGNHMDNDERIRTVCEEKKKWFDFMMYVFVSKKEKEESLNE